MGTWTRNFLVRKADPDAVRNKLVTWLERKGFDQCADNPLFFDQNDDERSVCLVSNKEWIVVLYSEAFNEGDRLLSELQSWPVVLEVVIADSDVWGYDLIEDGELTASFNSNPRYFGGDDQKLPQNGDPERLCRVLGLEGREDDVRRCQNKKSLFSDFPCRSFCQALGASAGSLHHGDFDFRSDGPGSPKEIAGWRIETLFFERRRQLGEDPPGQILHSLSVREFETREARQSLDPESVRNLRRQIGIISLLFKPLTWIGMALGPAIRWWLKRRLEKPDGRQTGDPLLDGLSNRSPEPVSSEAGWLFNRNYGIRIRSAARPRDLPEALFRMPNEIFGFQVSGVSLSAWADRPEKLRNLFVLRNGRTLVSDELFFVGRQPARATVFRTEDTEKTRFDHMWFVEFDRFVVSISSTSEIQLSPEVLAAIKGVVQTIDRTPPA
jgi:hypothetical protein